MENMPEVFNINEIPSSTFSIDFNNRRPISTEITWSNKKPKITKYKHGSSGPY